MSKSPDAFRTISEVSEILGTPAHVLRFWESKFSQIKPVKRAGGRRYYRPQDIALLAGIKHVLHDQGMTIKGAQKLLREKGVKHVAALTDPDAPADVDAAVAAVPDTPADVPASPADPAPPPAAPDTAPPAPTDNVIGFTAMPPPTQPPAQAQPAPAQPAPAQSDPILPLEPATPAEPRLFATLSRANRDTLRRRAPSPHTESPPRTFPSCPSRHFR